jgi:dihydropteroate synthase
MSIVNATPDSFARTTAGFDAASVIAQARQAVTEGADLVDIGGESTRPGATPVDAATEMRRVMPVIEALAPEVDVPLSIDTMKASVAEAALRAGCTIVNDVTGFHSDPEMAAVAARHDAAVVLMANLRGVVYQDVMAAISARLRSSVTLAARAGIAPGKLILDPGFGFGPPPADNLEMVRRLGELRAFGRPLLLGVSRKGTIGRVLDLPVEERLEGTAALVALSIANGADIVRVHDTRAMVRVARVTDAVVRGWSEPAPPATPTSAQSVTEPAPR